MKSLNSNENVIIELRRFLGTLLIISISHEQSIGSPWASFPKPKNFYLKICIWSESIELFKSRLIEDDTRLDDLIQQLNLYKAARGGQYPNYDSTFGGN